MIRPLAAIVLASAALVTAGCSQVQSVASDTANNAVSGVTRAAADKVVSEICAPLQDGQVSPGDKQLLSGLLAAAQTAGVSPNITGPLQQIAQSGDKLPADAVKSLGDACTSAVTKNSR